MLARSSRVRPSSEMGVPVCSHCSKEILIYQGVVEQEEADLMVVAREIVSEGIRDGQLRDEIYCQICKQTCYTPTEYVQGVVERTVLINNLENSCFEDGS